MYIFGERTLMKCALLMQKLDPRRQKIFERTARAGAGCATWKGNDAVVDVDADVMTGFRIFSRGILLAYMLTPETFEDNTAIHGKDLRCPPLPGFGAV
ncbi:MAG: hypothetical protein Q9176_001875 [Flavoplaca citrina]